MGLPFAYPPETTFDVIFWASLLLALLVFGLVAATLLYRFLLFLRELVRGARLRRYEALVEGLVVGDLELERFFREVPAGDRQLVESMLLELAGKFTGEVRDLLQHAFVGLGSVPRAVKQTRSPFWFRRATAAVRLEMMGHKGRSVTHSLRAMLADPEPEVQVAAARALVDLQAHDMLPDIVSTLSRVETYSVLRMADILMEAGQASVPALMAFLRQPAPPRAHSVALEQLGALRAVEAEGLIRECLTSPSMEIRAAACRAMGRIQSLEAVTALIDALRDEAWQVRGQASRALGEIGDPVAVEPLLPLLGESHWWTVYNTARSLAQLGATAELEKALAGAPDPSGTLPSILREVLSQVEKGV